MLKRSVIATQIANLTDARYFAARGINYLLYDLDEIDIQKINEIQEWVEGPETLLLFSDRSFPLIDEAVIRLSPAGIGAKSPKAHDEFKHLAAHVELFEWSKRQISLPQGVYSLVQSLTDLQSLNEDQGLIISGGDEEDVGMKSFDDLDEILDAIEE